MTTMDHNPFHVFYLAFNLNPNLMQLVLRGYIYNLAMIAIQRSNAEGKILESPIWKWGFPIHFEDICLSTLLEKKMLLREHRGENKVGITCFYALCRHVARSFSVEHSVKGKCYLFSNFLLCIINRLGKLYLFLQDGY